MTITPFLWFDNQAEEAANFYVSIFKQSRIIFASPMMVTFELEGQPFMALNGGPEYKFTPAISLYVDVESQAEIDDLWEKLSADGGAPVQCGWITDKFGLSWQIIPKLLGQLMSDPDPEKVNRVYQAMLKMKKIDIAALQQAYDGNLENALPTITVSLRVKAPVATVWDAWTQPEAIKHWCFASDDWGVPFARNEVVVGRKFTTTMAAKDNSARFDFEGVYTRVIPHQRIEYGILDGRSVSVMFESDGEWTTITETFEPEKLHGLDQQLAGWQAILDNFGKYVTSITQ